MKRPLCALILVCFLVTGLPPVHAQELSLPSPGAMVALSPRFRPAVLKGIKIDPENPFRFHFYMDVGDGFPVPQKGEVTSPLRDESNKLIKYFLASLTIPDKDLWVNLSPYEKDRVVPVEFGQTEMGRDLLAQDYLLKQITASLIYPEGEVGKKFWQKVYKLAAEKYGTSNIPVNTFNKVWIVPDKAVVYENAGVAFVLENRLKVMLEEDYLSMTKHNVGAGSPGPMAQGGATPPLRDVNKLGEQIVREIVIPELTREVNEGKNFAPLRQVFYALILATWYKKKIKDSILNKVYANRNKIGGVDVSAQDKEAIYQQYVAAFKKGVYNYIKEDPDPAGVLTPRKYFSGGVEALKMDEAMTVIGPAAVTFAQKEALKHQSIVDVFGDCAMVTQPNAIKKDAATTAALEQLNRFLTDHPSSLTIHQAGQFYAVDIPLSRKEPLPRKSFVSVTTPFNSSDFHFGDDWEHSEGKVIWEGSLNGRDFSFIRQNYPFASNHFLITPQRKNGRPQILGVEDIQLALAIMEAKPFERFRIGFNSLMAGASVNHLHLHGLQLPVESSPLERAPLKLVRQIDGVAVSAVENYPTRALMFSGSDPQALTAVTYRYIRFLQRSEIAHNVVFTPEGIYVIPQKTVTAINFGFYEQMGFVMTSRGALAKEISLWQIIAHAAVEADQFTAAHQDGLNGQIKGGSGKYYSEHLTYKTSERRVTNINGEILPQAALLMGRFHTEALPMKTIKGMPVKGILNTSRADRKSAWTKLQGERDCPVCSLLAQEHGHQMGIGHGFVMVPDQFPYVDRTATIVDMDHRAPVLDRGLTESMMQMLYELGPLGFRIGYNFRGAGQKIDHESFRVFPQEMPIEQAETESFLTFEDITVKTIKNFPTQAIILETRNYGAMVNELIRMQEFLDLMHTPFNILLSMDKEGTIRAFIMLRTDEVPKGFNGKTFGVIESSGVLLLEDEQMFNDPDLHEKAKAAYAQVTLDADDMQKLLYVYKMHMALGRLGLRHHMAYEIDTTGSVFYVSKVPLAGEVVKAFKLDWGPKGNRSWKWEDFFTQGYDIARFQAGDLIAPLQGVDIDEHGRFVPSEDDPDYLVQKIVPGETAENQINHLLAQEKVDVNALMNVYETVLSYLSALMERGLMDIDVKRYLVNFRGSLPRGFDISHLRDISSGVNLFGTNGYAADFEEEFATYLKYMGDQYPVLADAIKERFGLFYWEKELKRRGIAIPALADQRRKVPMIPYHSEIVRLSQEGQDGVRGPVDSAMTGNASDIFSLLSDEFMIITPKGLADMETQKRLDPIQERALEIVRKFDMFSIHGDLLYDHQTKSAVLITGQSGLGKSNITSRLIQDRRFSIRADDSVLAYFDANGVLQASLAEATGLAPTRRDKDRREVEYAKGSSLQLGFVPVRTVVHLTFDDSAPKLAVSTGKLDEHFNDDDPDLRMPRDQADRIKTSDIFGVNVSIPAWKDRDYDALARQIGELIPKDQALITNLDEAKVNEQVQKMYGEGYSDPSLQVILSGSVMSGMKPLFDDLRASVAPELLDMPSMDKLHWSVVSTMKEIPAEDHDAFGLPKSQTDTSYLQRRMQEVRQALVNTPAFRGKLKGKLILTNNGVVIWRIEESSFNEWMQKARSAFDAAEWGRPSIVHMTLGRIKKARLDEPARQELETKINDVLKRYINAEGFFEPEGELAFDELEMGQYDRPCWKPLTVERTPLKDAAMNTNPTGGIDLNPVQMELQVKEGAQSFKFNVNGVEMDTDSVTGAVFNIRTITPVLDLPVLLGLPA